MLLSTCTKLDLRSVPMPMGEMRSWVEAGEVLIAYPQNGEDMREIVTSAVTFSAMTTAPMAGIPGSESVSAAQIRHFGVA